MSKLDNQQVELFRAGDHGENGIFTAADVAQMAANYAAAGHEAPLTLGHQAKPGDPAYGWLKTVEARDGLLLGTFAQVEPRVEAAWEAGRFRNRSVGIRKTAKGYELHHVALLGAEIPLVKGLADAKFSDGEEFISIEFAESDKETGMAELKEADKQSIIDRITAEFRSAFSPKEAVRTFSEDDVKRIAAESAATAVAAATAPLEARLKTAETTFSEREKAISNHETLAKTAAAIARVKNKGAWVPAFDRLGVPQLFAEMAKSGDVIEFGEGAAKTTKSPLDTLTEFMEQLGPIVPNAPVYTGQSAAAAAPVTQINNGRRTPADPHSSQLSQLAAARALDKSIDFGAALTQVAAEHPELTVPGGAAAGAV